MNIADIEAATDALAKSEYDAGEFALQLFAAYDAPPATITRIRNGSQNATDLDGAFLWKRKMHVFACLPGEVPAALERLAGSKATRTHKVQFLIATDGEEVAARDIVTDEARFFPLNQLKNRFTFFLPAAGYQRFAAAEENPVDIKASAQLKRLYDALQDENDGWAEGDEGQHNAHLLMTRLIFCLFAEDTGVFPDDLFARTIAEQGGRDGEEMPRALGKIFAALANDGKDRDGLPDWATKFPYVNGGLFEDDVPIPRFSRTAFRILTDAAALDWGDINPDIFGSMIQTIVDKDQRHETGLHYTSVPNILKCLDPLFLDDLRAEAERKPLADQSREKKRLRAILRRLSKIRVFDPACGSGNFLVIAYREMRRVEMAVLARLRELTGETPGVWSHVELDNFYGIEISDFAAETAKLSLWIAKYQMDREYEGSFGKVAPALPIKDAGHIVTGNALREDWLKVCPPPVTTRNKEKVFDLATVAEVRGTETVNDNEVETYIVANPPYLGAKKKTATQVEDMSIVGLSDAKLLDYVCAFIVKSCGYARKIPADIAMVSTSSICQGEQVSALWPLVWSAAEIKFAYRPFRWSNSATENAGVWCTIVGLSTNPGVLRRLFYDDRVQECKNIAPYLVEGPNLVVEPRANPIGEVAHMRMGSNAVDGKHLILDSAERDRLIHNDPRSERFIKAYGGTKELASGVSRWCLWVEDRDLETALDIPGVRAIVDACRDYRLNAGRDARKAAARPHAFCYSTFQNEQFVQIGNTIGNKWPYVPADLKSSGFVSNHNAFTIYGLPMLEFSLITSSIHRVWAETVGGRLGNGVRYGNTTVWHTFPVPDLNGAQRERLTKCAEDILVTRAELGGTLAKLYDPDKMPDALREVHRENDRTLERIYTDRPFRSDADRLNHLFRRYARMIAIEKGEDVPDELSFDFDEPEAVTA